MYFFWPLYLLEVGDKCGTELPRSQCNERNVMSFKFAVVYKINTTQSFMCSRTFCESKNGSFLFIELQKFLTIGSTRFILDVCHVLKY